MLKTSRTFISWYVYIVRCADETLYTGITTNIPKRILQHNTDNKLGSRFVRVRRPVRLIYQEVFPTRSSALRREFEIKGWSRKKKLTLINGSDSMKSKLILRNEVTDGAVSTKENLLLRNEVTKGP